MDPNCLFCKIVARKLPGKIVFENERVVAFEDIAPVAPTHVMVVPREHFASSLEVNPSRHAVVGARRGHAHLAPAAHRTATAQSLPAAVRRLPYLHLLGGNARPPG
jgi:hypothetical protein